MMYYVVYVFDMAGFTGNVGLSSSGVEYAVFLIGTFVSVHHVQSALLLICQ